MSKLKAIIAEERGNGDFYKKILRITWPAFIELFMAGLFGMVSLAMVGRLGAEATSGVGLTNQPFFLLVAVFAAVNVGVTTLVSWAVGAGERQKADLILRQTIVFNALAGVLLTLLGLAVSDVVFDVMTKNDEAKAFAILYFNIVCTSLAFQGVNMGVTAVLRGCGMTRLPMIYNLAANALNVPLNFALIYGVWGFPEWGVKGAAVASVIARGLACAAALCVVMFYKKSPARLRFKGWKVYKLDFGMIRDIFSIGLPAAGEQFVIQSGLMIFNAIVSHIDVLAHAAHVISMNINGQAFMISQAFSVATTTLVGQSVGANDYAAAEKFTRVTRTFARVVALFAVALMIIFSNPLTRLYTDDPRVVQLCMPLFFIMAGVQFTQSTQMSTAGALRGAGDTMYPLYASVAGIWVFRVVVAWVFVYVFKWGLLGAWGAFLLDQCMRSFVIQMRFRGGKWKEAKARREERRRVNS